MTQEELVVEAYWGLRRSCARHYTRLHEPTMQEITDTLKAFNYALVVYIRDHETGFFSWYLDRFTLVHEAYRIFNLDFEDPNGQIIRLYRASRGEETEPQLLADVDFYEIRWEQTLNRVRESVQALNFVCRYPDSVVHSIEQF